MSPARPWPPHRGTRGRIADGFTMIEMLIVVALVGIMATIALPSFKHSTQKAREAVLREDLWVMRDVIDQFYTDHARYPASLDEIAELGYMRAVPIDPITGSRDTWEVSYEALDEEADEDSPELEEPGVTDIHSGSTQRAMDGTTFYNEW